MPRRSTKSAVRSRTSGDGDQPSSHTDESSGRKQPSPTAVATLPSATTVCHDEGSTLQSRTTQHGTTEIEALPQASQAERDARFYKRLEMLRSGDAGWDCVCPPTKCESGKNVLSTVGVCLKYAGRACYVLCLPPLLSSCLDKAAFWPPYRGYYFVREEGGSVKKLTKADKYSLYKPWSIGFEHKCAKFKNPDRAEFFVIETRQKHYIACAMIRCSSARPRFTILYAHSNGSELSSQVNVNGTPSRTEDIAEFLECDIVTFDYSGYGISSGRCNEKSLFADIEGVYQHLITVRKIEPAKIVILGYSIGTAAAIALVAETQAPVAGVILLAPLASMLRVLLWKRLCFDQPFTRRAPCVDKYSSLEKIALVKAPVLVCHGKEDALIPIAHGEALYAKAPNKVAPLWVPDRTHGNLKEFKEVWERVRHFLYNELASPGTPIAPSQPAAPLLATPLGTPSPVKPML